MTDQLDDVIDALIGAVGPDVARRNAPIGPLTTYRVGGSAAVLLRIDGAESLDAAMTIVGGSGVATLVIGRGSNLLVADDGFAGVAIQLGDWFSVVEIDGIDVFPGAAAKLPVVARQTVQAGLTGFEWAVGVPGSVGGAIRMNAGGHGAEIVDSLVAVEILDLAVGQKVVRQARELDLSYRSSNLRSTDVVLRAQFGLEPGNVEIGREEMAEIVQWRRVNQPGGQNAGSVFTNPDGDSAGRLIEAAGAKGLRIGTAEVSTKHANFIQADEHGRAADVVAVMREVRHRVRESQGVTLQAETHLVGFDSDDPFDEEDKRS